MPVHNEAKKGEIAQNVLMPGDPLRAKYIAENFLDNYRLVNNLRGMYAYTGKYKGKDITVMASGMGMPSMGIYAYELYDFYDVKNIIRIGTCGAFDERVGLLDIILVDNAYNEGNFAYNYDNKETHWVSSSEHLNNIIKNTAIKNNIKYVHANIACTECFDPYQPNRAKEYVARLPKASDIVGTEMESFALFYIASKFNRNSACLLSVVDTNYPNKNNDKIISSEDRQNSLNDMIKLALESTIEI